MNRQRKVVITTTYNDLGIIVDTKAEELDSSAQPNLQPICNNLATDTISRQAAIDEIAKRMPHSYTPDGSRPADEGIFIVQEIYVDCIEILETMPSVQPESCGDAVSRNAIIRALNTMDRYVSDELTLCNTYIKFPKNEVFIVDDVYEEIAENLPSVQPEQNDAEFWRKRADEYEKMFFDLYWRMMNGVKFESMQFDKNGITLKMKEPSQEDNT